MEIRPGWTPHLHLANSGNEPEAFATQGLDESLLATVVTNSAASCVDPCGHCRFRNDPPLPHCSQQFVLSHQAFAIGDQKGQQVKNLGFDGYDTTRVAQLPLAYINLIV